MTTRYVNAKTGKTGGKFDTALTPARSITAALKVAIAGDTIVIQDAESYKEGELVIDKPLTLVSSFLLANPSADPTAAGFDPKKLPELTIKSGTRARVLRITGTPATRASAGPVVIKGLRIRGGRSLHTSTEPAQGAGGGIAVVDIDNVTIERCVFTDNQTETAPIGSWPEADRTAFRDAVVDLVGAIFTPTVESFINTLIDTANFALVLAGYPKLAHVSRATILTEVGKAFDAKLGSGRPNHWLAGQAFGGGAATVWASPTFRRCLFRGNSAEGRGAGIAVVGYGWPTLDACVIDGNRSGNVGRRDGGGVGCEVALPGKLPRNLSEIDMVKFLTSKLAAVKAIIGSPLSYISVWDIINYAKWLANPAAPSPPVRGIKAVILDLINARWSEALDHLFYFASTSALSLNKWDAWNADEIKRAQTTAVSISDSTLSKNWCADDGGGLYASVLSRVDISKSKVLQNTADSSGGGLRFSMGSAANVSGCELLGNTAEVNDPSGKLVAGGGGMSARNVDLVIKDTRLGPAAAAIGTDSNVCSDHAGGGFAYQADTEGMLAGIPDLWTAIMVEVFGVRAVSVMINSGCAIVHNGAGYTVRRGAIGSAVKSKGGGVWFVQGIFPDAPKLTLRIDAVATVVSGNIAQTRGYLSKVQPGTTIATANEVCIQNLIARQEWTEVNYASLVKAGALDFKA
ncbi:hypothetical protein LVY75_21020 [Sinorhizobium sp. B11]